MIRLFVDRLPSPIGTMTLVWDEAEVLRALDFEDHDARLRRLLQRHYGMRLGTRLGTRPVEQAQVPTALKRALRDFFAGDLDAITALAVDTNGTAFQRRVWAALRRIPAGATCTYGTLAAAIGAPTASRAVGLANGSNPIAIVVPCHRVIGADGTLTGYGGGLPRKRWLLDHEERWSTAARRASA